MRLSIDQMDTTHTLHTLPKRIVSLVPSITELLVDLELEKSLVGCTKFCVHPKYLTKKITQVGGTKTVMIEKVRELYPQLIIANKEENVKAQVLELESICPVWVSDVSCFEDALQLIKLLGTLMEKEYRAHEILRQMKLVFDAAKLEVPIRVAYLIWKKPYMTIGGDTFIHSILSACGYQNVFAEMNRYPEISLAEIEESKPQCIFLSSEPFPFQEKHIMEIKEHLPYIPIHLTDGEFFSWYGSRQLHCRDYIKQLHLQTTH